MLLSYWQKQLAGLVRYPFEGGGGGGTTVQTTNVSPATPAELEAQQLALDQLRKQADWSDKWGPLLDQQLQDYINEQTVRSGGKVLSTGPFNEAAYFAANPGLEAALAGTGMTGQQHWEAHGKSEGRAGGPAADPPRERHPRHVQCGNCAEGRSGGSG